MGTDDTIARLRLLSERLDRIRQQSREVHDVAADEVRNAHTSRQQRDVTEPSTRGLLRRLHRRELR